MQERKHYGSPSMSLEQAQEELAQGGEAEDEEEHLLISQLRARRERIEPTESMVPFALVDPKGKAPKSSTTSPKEEEED